MSNATDLSALPVIGPEVPFWENFFEHCPVPGWVCAGKDRTFVALNRAGRELFGLNGPNGTNGLNPPGRPGTPEPRSWLGRSWQEVHHAPPELWKNGDELHLKRGDGTVVNLKICVACVRWGSETPAWHVCGMDVSDKRELETLLLRNQRMECVGMLASGVAHDLNNVLSPMMMAASMLNSELPVDQKQEFIRSIEESARQGVALLRQVLDFVKGIEGKHEALQLEALIKDVLQMVRRTFPKTIDIRNTTPAGELWKINGDATQLQQVILNLALNARDAMDTMEMDATLEISAANRLLTEADVAHRPRLAPGRYVQLEVRDSGPGVPEEMQDEIFKPFFTTKAPERGSGLGLTTILGITKSHRGWIELDSIPGRGATFRILLPAGESQEECPLHPPAAEPEETVSGEVVLVVDDEPGICRLIDTVLTRKGYEVVLTASGPEALDEVHRRNVHVILADLMMPGMDGIMLVRALRRLESTAAIVITSGAELDSRLGELRDLGVSHFLKKPYRAPDLVALIAKAAAERRQQLTRAEK